MNRDPDFSLLEGRTSSLSSYPIKFLCSISFKIGFKLDSQIGPGLRPRLTLAEFFFIPLFPNWTANENATGV